MTRLAFASFVAASFTPFSMYPQTPNPEFKLALAEHTGQLRWHAEGFTIIQTSAKANGHEIGVRAQDASGRLTFMGFLFLIPKDAPLTAAKCRDGIMDAEKKADPKLKAAESVQMKTQNGFPVTVVTYTARGENEKPGIRFAPSSRPATRAATCNSAQPSRSACRTPI